MREVTMRRVISIGAILAAIWALLYLLRRMLKEKSQNNGRRTVYAEYKVKE